MSIPPTSSTATSSAEMLPAPISPQATIELLRRELERCHIALETDEELYAEKVEELDEVQRSREQMREEVERWRELREGGRRREEELEGEVWRLMERVAELEGREGERRGGEEGGLGGGSGERREEGGGGREKSGKGGVRGGGGGGGGKGWSEVGKGGRVRPGEREEGGTLAQSGQGEMCLSEFEAQVHLLRGRVRTEREEVRREREEVRREGEAAMICPYFHFHL